MSRKKKKRIFLDSELRETSEDDFSEPSAETIFEPDIESEEPSDQEGPVRESRETELETQVASLHAELKERTRDETAEGSAAPEAAAEPRKIRGKIVQGTEEKSRVPFKLDTLLRVMVKHKASDLHLKAGNRPMARLDGELVPVGHIVLTQADTYQLVTEVMPEPARRRFDESGYADFAYSLPEARFRINAYLQQSSMSAAIRLLRLDIPSFEELYLPQVLRRVAQFNNGLVLVTGPAGNGKSTTLAAIIDFINATQKKHVITIEDPIEFVHADKESIISQREIGTDTPSFFDALKQALRQDPNVILIGEMRDPETIWTAAMAAETGHLVLSTLHTPNTTQAIDRILDAFSGEQQRQFRRLLAHTLRAVISQRLLPRADQSGRVVAVEVMIVTSTIASLIAEGTTAEIYQYIVQGGHEGMQTFTESLTKLYQERLVTKEVALYHAEHPTEFRLGIEGHTTGTQALDWSLNA